MTDVNELYQQAERLRAEGKIEEEIATLQQLVDADAQHTLAYLALAVACGKVERFDDSIAYAQKACEIDPTDPFHFSALSVTYQRAWQGTQRQEFIQLAEAAMAKAHELEGRA